MARRIIWTEEALTDIEAIADYIRRDSPHHAWRVVETILDVAESMCEQPYMGRIVPEFGDRTLRERFIYSYRIIYKLQDDTRLYVMAVIHGQRLLESMEDRFK